MPTAEEARAMPPALSRPLVVANAVLLAAVAVHAADHVRQERGLGAVNTEVIAGGQLTAVLAVLALVLAVRRHPLAAQFTVAVGLSIALGVTAGHVLPEWSAFSDPYPGLGLDALSWAAMLAELAAAAAAAVTGFVVLRRAAARGGTLPRCAA